jgi:hypothetical protein
MYPEGISADGALYPAKTCRTEGLWFGRATDGSWSIPITPQSRG